MSPELCTLFTNIRLAVADEQLSRIASDPAYKAVRADSPRAMPLIDRPWFITGMYVVCSLVLGGVISRVIV